MMEGSHSCNKAFEALQAKYGVKHKVAQLTIHKQVVKRRSLMGKSNREINRILEKVVSPKNVWS